MEDFERLRKAGVQFDSLLLCQLVQLVLDIIANSTHPKSNNDTVNETKGTSIREMICPMSITPFMQSSNTACRSQTRMLLVSEAKPELTDRPIAYHFRF